MAAFAAFPEATPVTDYQISYRTSEDGVTTLKMGSTGTPPTRVFQRKDGFWFSYSPDGKYIAMVVADLEKAVISSARLAAMSKASVGEGVAPDAIASTSGSLHPATPRWLEIIDATTFQTLHKLDGVAGLEEYFYWSPKSRYIVTWQPLTVPSANAVSATTSTGPVPTSSSPGPSVTTLEGPNTKVWDIMTGKVVMHFKHAQRQGWPMVRWTDDEKICARWASGQIHLYHWAKASFHQTPEENFSGMARETIDKQNVWDWSITRSAIAIFQKENAAQSQPAHVLLYPLNTSLGEDPQLAQLEKEKDQPPPQKGATPTKANTSGANNNSSSPQGKGKQGGKQGGKTGQKGNAAIPTFTTVKEPNLTGDAPAPAATPTTSSETSSAGESTATEAAPKLSSISSLTTMAPSQPICSKSFFNCDDVQFHWHNRGQALLVLATTQRDQTGSNNYYGNTYLYYLPGDGKGETDVVTDKKGPIHDVKWNAKGNDFAMTYGEYPSKTALYNRKCKALGHLGTESRNKLVWSPQGRVLMSGGFGQLPGNFDIWDTVSLTKLGSAQSFTSAHHEWSPDGKFLLTASLWPRMRIDNFFAIYDLSANHLFHLKLPELWKVCWRPMPGCASAYPASPQAPIVVAKPPQIATVPSSSTGRSAPSSEPYRPPHAKRAANSQFAQSQVPLKEAKVAPERFAPPSNPNAKSSSAASSSASSSSPSSSPAPKVPIGGMPVKKSNNNARSGSGKSSPSKRN